MTTKISEANIQATTLETIGSPKITSVVVVNSSYVPTGAQTVGTAGGYLKLLGTGFVAGAQVLFDETAASAVVVVNSTTIHAQVSTLAVGSYFVYVVNPDGSTAVQPNSLVVA